MAEKVAESSPVLLCRGVGLVCWSGLPRTRENISKPTVTPGVCISAPDRFSIWMIAVIHSPVIFISMMCHGVREAPFKLTPHLFGHCLACLDGLGHFFREEFPSSNGHLLDFRGGGGGSKPLPGWFGALMYPQTVIKFFSKIGPKISVPECPFECGAGLQSVRFGAIFHFLEDRGLNTEDRGLRTED